MYPDRFLAIPIASLQKMTIPPSTRRAWFILENTPIPPVIIYLVVCVTFLSVIVYSPVC